MKPNAVNHLHFLTKLHRLYSGMFVVPIIILYPLTGWLADTYCGRYKAIKCGMCVMWIASVLFSLLEIFKYTIWKDESFVLNGVGLVIFIIMGIGLGWFQANILQFGIDQLIDASSADITSYINWYVWTFFASEVVIQVTQKCGCCENDLKLMSTLVIPLCLSLALVSDFLFSKYLVIEPVTYNPLKLLYSVLKYAMKNKYPRMRSAFTYWDDRRYSRIDLAKTIYGGPFTIEQVENVKTFFRILLIIGTVSPLIAVGYVHAELVNESISNAAFDNLSCIDCFKKVAIALLGSVLVVFFIPVYEFFIYPIFWKKLLKLTYRTKFTIGMFCMQLHVIVYLIFYLAEKKNRGKSCQGVSSYSLDDYSLWLIILKVLECSAKILLFGSALEFICAQSPYSMKGLLFGMVYGTGAVCIIMLF